MSKEKLKFIDLFAGIGGFRLGFENAGCECVFSSEIDAHTCEIYELNPTIKYYLRLLDNTDIFVERYVKNLSDNTEINFEHKIAWNTVCREN